MNTTDNKQGTGAKVTMTERDFYQIIPEVLEQELGGIWMWDRSIQRYQIISGRKREEALREAIRNSDCPVELSKEESTARFPERYESELNECRIFLIDVQDAFGFYHKYEFFLPAKYCK